MLEIEVVKFEAIDIITASTPEVEGDIEGNDRPNEE